jgi:hypothetical protein
MPPFCFPYWEMTLWAFALVLIFGVRKENSNGWAMLWQAVEWAALAQKLAMY